MPKKYASDFSEPDLSILAKLVRDSIFSKVYGDTAVRNILNQVHYHLIV